MKAVSNSFKEFKNSIYFQLFNYESFKISRRGMWNIVSLAILVGYFLLCDFLKQYWPKKVENPGKFYFFVTLGIHHTYFITNNFVMYLVYKLNHPIFEQYKTSSEPWPWEENYTEWRKLLSETFKQLFINQFIVVPLLLLPYLINNNSIGSVEYDELPNLLTTVLHLCFFMIVEDFLFYWSHRILHHKSIYSKIHKRHHMYKKVVGIASEFCHPIEMILANTIPTSAGLLILGKRTHLYIYYVWMIFRMSETTDGHSGYEFPWVPFRFIPLGAGQEFHNYHHLNFDGNYGSFTTFWDRICNTTNKPFIKYIDNLHKNGKSSNTINFNNDPCEDEKKERIKDIDKKLD